jgi:hypothetical protein
MTKSSATRGVSQLKGKETVKARTKSLAVAVARAPGNALCGKLPQGPVFVSAEAVRSRIFKGDQT